MGWFSRPDAVMRWWAAPIQYFVDAPEFPGGVASLKVVSKDSNRLTHGSVYLDHTRFTIEDVKDSFGTKTLHDRKREPTEALRKLMEMDAARWRSAT